MKEEILRRIRMARLELGFSQQNVADELDIGRPAYSKIERGVTELTMERLEQIAVIVKKEVGELLGLEKSNANIGEQPMIYEGTLTQQVLLLSSQLNAVQYKLGQLEQDVRRLESRI